MLEPTHLAPGSVVAGDYRILRALARGGMGSVYVAEQLSTGRERALKVLHAQLTQQDVMRRRFEQEARIGAKIKSEHVVEVIAAGVDDAAGTPWLVMELLEGEDLADYLSRTGPLSPTQTGEIIAQLCHALGAAHAVGVVHRDLKPENVFLATSRRLGASFTVKVLDFGIAKVVAEAKSNTTDAVGTPLYMAPEQTSAGQSVGPQADVWALGLLVFHMLTGRPYWKGGNTGSSSAMAVLREVVIEPLVTASERAQALGAAGELPPGFDDWFARAVAREPADRFPDAAQAYRALAAIGFSAGSDTDALAATQPLDAAAAFAPTMNLSDARTGNAALTPSPLSRTEDPADTVSAASAGRFPWLGAAGLGAAIVGGLVWWGTTRKPPDAPSRAETTRSASVTNASHATSAAPTPAPGNDATGSRGPLVHVCGSDEGQGDRNRCKEPSFPWCNKQGRFVACCSKSLVPSGSSGACECAPGGAVSDEAIAGGCPKAEGAQGLPKGVVQAVIKTATTEMRDCYVRELEKNQVLSGQIELGIEITPWGDVFDARIRNSSLPNPRAQECVLAVVRNLRFPPIHGGGTVQIGYPVRFELAK